mmetsp:Transcript_133403/g.198336  ORF Transcript_133403/g.198336 Transcript_133403/m.198336 type:complete len:262 (+) Transcript_133403:149-934(+)|eukprot:CAMPEP_0117054724 /NCGR_PEP_ID=MMETSP0472-20121206/37926_1 /TAXON_ID=693140 ORGANISM="Tiarina fusus, Strain LIS" /NCGR_SAMPLE_ID=MMETSP0472 /ASSEMBLY_ACC=CAM_ASM_000603 /LENGTH=261 /DNA_ID=CAMNT_0004770423 /DNA_START=147 /DNA_END=932 /DNA_ORIENTATION=-
MAGKKLDLVVVAPTFYPSVDDLRYLLGAEACRQAAEQKISLLLIDASPLEQVKHGLEDAGKPFVRVVQQKWEGKKGVALREAIHVAFKELSKSEDDSVIAFMELEKVDMFRHWNPLVQHMVDTNSDVTVPRRADASFRTTYPIEQYFSENFVNLYLDSLGREIGLAPIDWTMGPVAFRSKFANHWLEYEGDLWDVQLVPLVNAHSIGAKVSSFKVDYQHPPTMKEQEEGSALWGEKRLYQINVLKDTVGARMKKIAQQAKN